MSVRQRVIFYYPRHFNRSAQGTNPYFDPLIAVCERKGIPYRLLEEPDNCTDKPRNPKAESAVWFLYFVLACRKLLPLRLWKSFDRRERFIGKWLGLVTCGRWHAAIYITISNSMIEVLAGLNPGGRVYDMQHGVIHSTHSGYFNPDKTLLERFRNTQIHQLVYGEGYARCFRPEADSGGLSFLGNRVHVIGDVLNAGALSSRVSGKTDSRRSVVVSLQFVRGWSPKQQDDLITLLVNLLREIAVADPHMKYRVLLKHHPRFNNVVDLSHIVTRFPFAEITTKALSDLALEACWHVTLHSTTAFEFAAYGVPTFFWVTREFPEVEALFINEYGYPSQPTGIAEALRMTEQEPEKYSAVCRDVKAWHDLFYSPFDEMVAMEILAPDVDKV